ncbi:uncharacterized protein LOC124166822 [Ischnura elegans]|uniref:uncharacterized protein LOC124166822 n=1 Tax=Ischnura elegans TaxID=197161 RepID=UPI001ED88080|nr:uncharacterized protein LOC124166822 [Ischnura elegans]
MAQRNNGNASNNREIENAPFEAVGEDYPVEYEDLLQEMRGYLDELQEDLKNEKAPSTAHSGSRTVSGSGGTLLHAAVRRGNLAWVDKLLGMGASPTLHRDIEGYTPLTLAERMVELNPLDNSYKAVLSALQRVAMEVTSSRSGKEFLEKVLAEIRAGHTLINSNLSKMHDNQKASNDLIRELVENYALMVVRMETLSTTPLRSLKSLESHATDLKQTVGIINIRSDVDHEKTNCINKMMQKTMIKNATLDKIAYVKELYTNLYECDVLTSSLLHYLQSDDSFGVIIDCTSANIEGIKPQYKNIDGEVFTGDKDSIFADREENRVYLAALRTSYFRKQIIMSRFARALAILAINNLYHNEGRPYSVEDKGSLAAFQEAMAEAVAKKDKIPKNHLYVPWAVGMKSSLGREARLAAVPVEYVAEFGSVQGRKLMKDHVPILLRFYEENVLPKLH